MVEYENGQQKNLSHASRISFQSKTLLTSTIGSLCYEIHMIMLALGAFSLTRRHRKSLLWAEPDERNKITVLYALNMPRYPILCVITLLAVQLSAGPGMAANRSTAAHPLSKNASMIIDGRLDEPIWQDCRQNEAFTQRQPTNGEEAQFATEFCVAYDQHALFVAIRAFDPEPEHIVHLLTRRDELSAADWVWIAIDGKRDRRNAFTFALNASGVQRDIAIYNDGAQEDASWRAVWQSATRIDDRGWTAEYRLPFSELRFNNTLEAPGTWGFQVGRMVQRTQEESYWAPRPITTRQQVSVFGVLTNLRNIRGSGVLVLTPQVLVGVANEPQFTPSTRLTNNFSADFQYGLTNNFTLTGTLNPDFGQVEADPSIVNLTAQENFFAEKRPFFLEGLDLFRMSLSQGGGGIQEELFYSRRIGAPPHTGAVNADGSPARTPANTSIYGAAKLSGSTANGWSVGAVNAITAKESVTLPGTEASTQNNNATQVLEPLTSYTVLGVQKTLRNGRSNISGLLTGVQRKLSGTDLNWLHSQAYTGGLSLDHRFSNDEWLFQARLLGSYVQGSPEALLRTQRSSLRYFQRPDSTHVRLNPNRTSMSGMGAQYKLVRFSGQTWRGGLGGQLRSPGFEANDLGFQQNADLARQWLWLQRRNDNPGPVLRDWSVNLNAWTEMNYEGERKSLGTSLRLSGRLLNYWGGVASIGYEDNTLWVDTLRGGPALRGYPAIRGWGTINSDARKPVRGALGLQAARSTWGDTWTVNVFSEAFFQASSNLDIRLGPFFSLRRDGRQYVGTSRDDTNGLHYIVGKIDQKTLGLTFRLNYTFSPNLSLQVYAQPFLSAGEYLHYKEAADTRAADPRQRFRRLRTRASPLGDLLFVDFNNPDKPNFQFNSGDFGFRQLRSNVVLRWEYLPGSILFAVWSHARTSADGNGVFNISNDLQSLLSQAGDDVFLVKVSYRFST